MSIRAFLAICLVVTGGVMAIMATLLVMEQWRVTHAAAAGRELVDTLAASTAISANLAPERGATGVAIAVADDATRQTMMEARRRTDSAIAEARRVLSAATFEQGTKMAAEIGSVATDLSDLRRRADALISGSPTERSNADNQTIIDGINALLARIVRFGDTMETTLSAVDANVAQPAALALEAWNLRDSEGSRSILMLQAINSGKPAPAELRRQMDRADGASDLTWQRLTMAAEAAGSPPALREAMGQVGTVTLPGLAALRQRVARAGLSDGGYDMTGAEWRRLSAPLLQSILSIRDAAITEARAVADARRTHARRNLLGVLALFGVALTIFAGVAWTVGARVIRPLGMLTSIVGRLADGTHDLVVPHADRSDERGRLARAIEILRVNARAAAAAAAAQHQEAQAKETSRLHLDQVTRGFAGAMDTVSAALRADADSVRNQADALLVTAETASQTSTTVAAAASHATSNVATAATAAGELSESVRDIARRVGEAASVTHHAVHEAEATGQVVAGLSEAATRIAKVVSLINGVAGQTNLLALNATIEAARAGEAGKGFAVVASEVKALAHQTAQATEDIQSHVASIRAETDRAVAAIGEIGKIIGTVNELTVTIAQAVERQGAATLEIATSVERAAAGTAEVSASISQVMTANRNTRDAVSHLVGLADDLSGRSGGLRNEVGHFLSDLHHAHG